MYTVHIQLPIGNRITSDCPGDPFTNIITKFFLLEVESLQPTHTEVASCGFDLKRAHMGVSRNDKGCKTVGSRLGHLFGNPNPKP